MYVMKSLRFASNGRRRGSALISAIVVAMLLAGMSGALLIFGTSTTRESVSSRASTRALFLAEAGANDAIMRFYAAAADDQIEPPTELGTQDMPLKMSSGDYYVDIVDADDTVTLTSYAMADDSRRAVEVVLASPQGGVYSSALFAGNSSGDPTYSLDLGGVDAQGDQITGDIYSAGDVIVKDDATVDGEIMAGGTIEGARGQEGYTLPTPDIAAMDYENTNDVDVLNEFNTGGPSYESDSLGGSAWQLPEANPAHIFRLNPSDRQSDYESTVKDDFFLEDPYEAVGVDVDQDGSDACPITLSGNMGNPGFDGNGLVYYIDGNLWIHNRLTYSMKFVHDNEALAVTFVVKGNVYFSDNLFYQDGMLDGVAFIAIVDEAEQDSGNIYFGDPVFGTLEHMSAFMYAENNFYDNNLSASGSAEVEIFGNMTAGNQVAINRDFGDQHSKLTVNFDDRIISGALEMPGLPPNSWGGDEYTLVSWREVPPEQKVE